MSTSAPARPCRAPSCSVMVRTRSFANRYCRRHHDEIEMRGGLGQQFVGRRELAPFVLTAAAQMERLADKQKLSAYLHRVCYDLRELAQQDAERPIDRQLARSKNMARFLRFQQETGVRVIWLIEGLGAVALAAHVVGLMKARREQPSLFVSQAAFETMAARYLLARVRKSKTYTDGRTINGISPRITIFTARRLRPVWQPLERAFTPLDLRLQEAVEAVKLTVRQNQSLLHEAFTTARLADDPKRSRAAVARGYMRTLRRWCLDAKAWELV